MRVLKGRFVDSVGPVQVDHSCFSNIGEIGKRNVNAIIRRNATWRRPRYRIVNPVTFESDLVAHLLLETHVTGDHPNSIIVLAVVLPLDRNVVFGIRNPGPEQVQIARKNENSHRSGEREKDCSAHNESIDKGKAISNFYARARSPGFSECYGICKNHQL